MTVLFSMTEDGTREGAKGKKNSYSIKGTFRIRRQRKIHGE